MTACCVVRHPNASPAGAVRVSTSSNLTVGSPWGAGSRCAQYIASLKSAARRRGGLLGLAVTPRPIS